MGTVVWGVVAAVVAAGVAPGPGFEVVRVADGVVALVRTKAPGFMLDANVAFIINDNDVVAVDANLTARSAEASLAALAQLTPNPVSTLVNTHRHADHTAGNGTYARAFPGLEIIGHEAMREDLAAHGAATLRGWVEWAGGMTRDLPGVLERGVSASGAPLTAEERLSLEGDLAAALELVADADRLEVVLPTRTVSERLTLVRGSRVIELLHLGAGHTRGDLIVWLPGERVALVGDLVVAPVPLVGADQSFPEEWVVTLDRLLELGATAVVPGHGSVLRGPEQIRLYRAFLAAVSAEAREALARGETEDEAIRALDVQAFRDSMTGGSPVLGRLFDAWGPAPAVRAVYRVHRGLRGG